MPINYPVSVDTLPTNRQNRVRQPVDADDINDIARYVNAIGAELGANPSGSYTDVAARLTEFRKSVAGIVSDASFTATPTDGAIGVNTTAGEFYYRSNGAWLSVRDVFADRVFNVKSARFAGGAKGDGQVISDAAITAGTAILTSASGLFTPADVGKSVQVKGGGAAGADLLTTILSRQSTTQVTLSANASTSVTGAYAAWGTDDAPAIRAALVAAGTRGTVVIPFGNYLLASGGPLAVTPNGSGLNIYGFGKKHTTLITTSACKVAFDTGWVGGADGDVFQDIWLTDLAVDGRVTTYPFHSSLLIGNLAGGDSAPRKNFQRIRVLRCATLYPPVTSANYLVSVESVAFTCRQTVGGEAGPTATFARDIRVEDCDFQGHVGVAVISKATSGIGTAQLDQLYVRNNTWDSGTPPTTLTGSVGLAQLGGSQGGHGHVEVTGNTCKNSWDIGIELDSWTTAIVERNTFIDSLNHHVLLVNFRAPANPNDQLLVVRGNEFRNVTLTPSAAAPGRHVYIGFNSTAYGTGDITSGSKTVLNASQTWARGQVITGTGIPAGTFVAAVSGSTLTLSQAATATTVSVALAHSGSVMGHILIEGNHSSFETAMTDVGTVLGLAVNASATAYYQSLTLRNHRIDCPNLATNPASGVHYVFCLIGSQLYGSRTVVDNVDLVLAGTIVNISSSYEVVRLAAAANEHVSVNRVAMDIQGVTTQTLGNVILAAVSVGYVSTAVVHGVIENIAITQQSSGQSAYMDLVLFGSNLTVPTGAFIRVRGGDSSRMVSSGGHDYDFLTPLHGKVIIEGIAAVGSNRTAGDPLRAPIAVTPPATGIAQQNTDYMPIEIQLSGGTGTLLEVSKDNSAWFTVFSQAAAAFPGVAIRVPAGWFWRPTYTVVPTAWKWPMTP
jgi:hypothetical protein